jgi:hypothetical protein
MKKIPIQQHKCQLDIKSMTIELLVLLMLKYANMETIFGILVLIGLLLIIDNQ